MAAQGAPHPRGRMGRMAAFGPWAGIAGGSAAARRGGHHRTPADPATRPPASPGAGQDLFILPTHKTALSPKF